MRKWKTWVTTLCHHGLRKGPNIFSHLHQCRHSCNPPVSKTLTDTPNTQTHLSTSTTPPSYRRMRYTPPIRQKTPKPRVQKQKATYGAMAAQMDSSIEPYDSPDAPTIRHIPLTSTPVFPQHDGNAHVITVQIHHQRTPSFEHTTSPPQNNLNLTSIFPLQHTLQHRHTTPTATPSPPQLTLQQSDVTPFITPHIPPVAPILTPHLNQPTSANTNRHAHNVSMHTPPPPPPPNLRVQQTI